MKQNPSNFVFNHQIFFFFPIKVLNILVLDQINDKNLIIIQYFSKNQTMDAIFNQLRVEDFNNYQIININFFSL